MIGVKDPDEYRRRRAEFLDKLVLKNPDINLLQSHPKEQYPFLVQTLEILLRQRVEAGKLVLPNLSAFTNQSLGIFLPTIPARAPAIRMTYSYSGLRVWLATQVSLLTRSNMSETSIRSATKRSHSKISGFALSRRLFRTISRRPTNSQDSYALLP